MVDRAPRILLVDDEPPIQTLLSYPLQKDGYDVVTAADGREALERSRMAPADREQQPLERGALRIDRAKRVVSLEGRPVATTFVEFEILATLASSPGRVYSRDTLLERIWGDSAFRDPR